MGTRTSYEPGTFSWVDVQTSDQEGAKAFYSGLFGWETDDRPAGEGVVYTMCSVGGEHVAAISPLMEDQASQGIPPHWNSYVTVASADEAASRAKELGGQVFAEPFDVLDAGRMAAIADPTGAVFMVWEPRDNIGAGRVNEPGCLSWNELATDDPARAQDFYSQLLGWSFEATDASGVPPYWVIEHGGGAKGQNGGLRELAPEQIAGGIPPNWLPYFAVDSVDASLARAEELGGQNYFGPMELPSGAKFAAVGDPQGAAFALFEGELDE